MTEFRVTITPDDDDNFVKALADELVRRGVENLNINLLSTIAESVMDEVDVENLREQVVDDIDHSAIAEDVLYRFDMDGLQERAVDELRDYMLDDVFTNYLDNLDVSSVLSDLGVKDYLDDKAETAVQYSMEVWDLASIPDNIEAMHQKIRELTSDVDSLLAEVQNLKSAKSTGFFARIWGR